MFITYIKLNKNRSIFKDEIKVGYEKLVRLNAYIRTQDRCNVNNPKL